MSAYLLRNICFATTSAGLFLGIVGFYADSPTSYLSNAEIAAVFGSEKPCGPPCANAGYIDYEMLQWNCLSPYPSDNTCTQRSCVGPNGDCGSGKKWTNNYIPTYVIYAQGTYDSYVATDTSIACYADITCDTGNVDNQKNCYSGSVGANDAFGYWAGTVGSGCLSPTTAPTGCRPCTPLPTDPLKITTKVDPYMKDCPNRDCTS